MSYPTEQLYRVEVDGDVALAVSIRGAPAPTRAFLHVFEQRPAPLGWVATQSVEIPGIDHVGAGNPDLFELEGQRAIAFSVATRELLVLEPDPLTGAWGPVFALPYPISGGITRARLGGDRIAVSSEAPERIDIWRRAANGTYSIEDVLTPLDPPNSYNFTTEFDFDGERLLHNDRGWLDVYSPDPTGRWRLATWFTPDPHTSVSGWFERTFLDGDRIAQVVGTHANGVYEVGIGF